LLVKPWGKKLKLLVPKSPFPVNNDRINNHSQGR